jgi:threonine dehydratase
MHDLYPHILAAADRLQGQAHRTPVFTSQDLNQRTGAQVFLKAESFQKIGAFKFRGAYNAISQLSPQEQGRGVITFSSGNHAQAVAKVGQLLGVKTCIVMPTNAPSTKLAATRGYGAEVILYNPEEASREALARDLAAQHGYVVIPPYDDERVLSGQGTAALELYQDHPGLDYLLVPVGGGGLLSGCAIAAKGLAPHTKVIGIEPQLADDGARSFKSGQLVAIHNPPTIADGTRTPSLGQITFPLIQHYVDDFHTVSEEAIKGAVRYLFYRMKLVVEPSGGLGVAALLGGGLKLQGRVGVILSGGNIDAATMSLILGETEGRGF